MSRGSARDAHTPEDERAMSDKYCKDCAAYQPARATKVGQFSAKCLHPYNASLVDGSPLKDPYSLRYQSAAGECGLNGAWWHKK
jgi:hypothetical protein